MHRIPLITHLLIKINLWFCTNLSFCPRDDWWHIVSSTAWIPFLPVLPTKAPLASWLNRWPIWKAQHTKNPNNNTQTFFLYINRNYTPNFWPESLSFDCRRHRRQCANKCRHKTASERLLIAKVRDHHWSFLVFDLCRLCAAGSLHKIFRQWNVRWLGPRLNAKGLFIRMPNVFRWRKGRWTVDEILRCWWLTMLTDPCCRLGDGKRRQTQRP